MHAHHNARARALIHNNSLQWCPCATHFSCFLSSPRYTLFSVTCYHCACSHFCVSAQCLCPQLYLCSSLSLSLPLSLDPYLPLFPSLRLSVDPLLTVTDTLIIPRSVRLNAAISLPPPSCRQLPASSANAPRNFSKIFSPRSSPCFKC